MAAINPRAIVVKSNSEEMVQELCSHLEKIGNAAIERDGNFKIGLSGGSLVTLLSKGLGNLKTDWSKWYIFFCDERILCHDIEPLHVVYEKLFRGLKIPIPLDNIIKVETDVSPSESTKDYISKLALHFPPVQFPRFHCLLLGLGEDGHICSLFPNDKVLDETSVWVAPVMNAPKPPPCRITLTFPVINNAENCIVSAYGSGKSAIMKDVFMGKDLPAAKIRLVNGKMLWILDKLAASEIPHSFGA